MNNRLSLVLLVATLFLASCGLKPTTGDENQTFGLISALLSKNKELESYKGIGRVRIMNQDGTLSARIAWMVSGHKLRTEVLGVLGQPMISMAYDNKYLYLNLHQQNQFYRRASDNPDLEPIISIPIRSKDLIDLLAGRIPIRNHHLAYMEKTATGYVLILKKWWGDLCEKIYLDDIKSHVEKIEMYDQGFLKYIAEICRVEKAGYSEVPYCLKLFPYDRSAEFHLTVHRFWPDAAVEDSAFVLTSKNSGKHIDAGTESGH
jgi:outer membrane protein assembly factor BamE (lipoprotein component of BamABCDE complex)